MCSAVRCSPGLPARHTHDYRRYGTTTLFAALDIVTGKMTATGQPRHRHQEFLTFLKQMVRLNDPSSGRTSATRVHLCVRAGARATDVRADELTGYLTDTLITSAGDGKRRQRGRVDR